MTDLDRWTALAREPESPWAERLRLLAARIQPGETVIDVGAGGMWLRGMIPASCLYLPVDCISSAPIAYTFGDKDAPDLDGDVVVMSGSLEYALLPDMVLTVMCEWAPRLLLSYCVMVAGTSDSRRASGFESDMYTEDVVRVLGLAGYSAVNVIGEWRDHVLFEARR